MKSLAEVIYIELTVPVVDEEAATLTSTVARAKRYIREADDRRQAWLERTRQEVRKHG